MKTILKLIICLITGVVITACDDDVPKDNTELITMWVSSETTTVYNEWLDADMECMLVKFSPAAEWEPMKLGESKGSFTRKGWNTN